MKKKKLPPPHLKSSDVSVVNRFLFVNFRRDKSIDLVQCVLCLIRTPLIPPDHVNLRYGVYLVSTSARWDYIHIPKNRSCCHFSYFFTIITSLGNWNECPGKYTHECGFSLPLEIKCGRVSEDTSFCVVRTDFPWRGFHSDFYGCVKNTRVTRPDYNTNGRSRWSRTEGSLDS